MARQLTLIDTPHQWRLSEATKEADVIAIGRIVLVQLVPRALLRRGEALLRVELFGGDIDERNIAPLAGQFQANGSTPRRVA